MKRALVFLIPVLIMSVPAVAVESGRCWTSKEYSPVRDWYETVTECRLEGEEGTVSFGSVSEVPWTVAPAVGVGADGTACWYWTAVRGADAAVPDPLWPIRELAACVSEPGEAAVPTAEEEAYGLLASYTHPGPDPVLDPIPGLGLAGLETYLTVPVPAPWTATLTSPISGRVLTVESRVAEVIVDWGDGERATVPVAGSVVSAEHVFEAKTCAEPGPRCGLVDAGGFPLTVSFRWEAQFDADGAGWVGLTVPSTVTVTAYPVAEIIATLTG